jgi:hypothetical protein
MSAAAYTVHRTALGKLENPPGRGVRLSSVLYVALQKAKGTPVIRVGSSSGAKIFQLDSLDAREAFLAVVNPVWKGASYANNNTNLGAHVPKSDIQKAVFEANPDLKALHERCVTTSVLPVRIADLCWCIHTSWHQPLLAMYLILEHNVSNTVHTNA